MTMQCPIHGDFPTEEAYLLHIKMDHSGASPEVDLIKIKANGLPPGIPESAIPTPDFIVQVQRIEAQKQAAMQKVAPPLLPLLAPEPLVQAVLKELHLEYCYTGNCPTCSGVNISTLMIEVEKNMIAVALCESCRKSVKQIKVKPLQTESKRREEHHGSNGIKTKVSVLAKMRALPSSKKRAIPSAV